MYDPCIPEYLKMYEFMVAKHARELLRARSFVHEVKSKSGEVIQAFPCVDLEFKFLMTDYMG